MGWRESGTPDGAAQLVRARFLAGISRHFGFRVWIRVKNSPLSGISRPNPRTQRDAATCSGPPHPGRPDKVPHPQDPDVAWESVLLRAGRTPAPLNGPRGVGLCPGRPGVSPDHRPRKVTIAPPLSAISRSSGLNPSLHRDSPGFAGIRRDSPAPRPLSPSSRATPARPHPRRRPIFPLLVAPCRSREHSGLTIDQRTDSLAGAVAGADRRGAGLRERELLTDE